ncbi:MAG: hypothetical protein IPK26_14510 [Planctomycetes bacterium]|nr:hypothetical protein [Planctomycetota bacterium]
MHKIVPTILTAALFAACGGKPVSQGGDAAKAPPPAAAKSYTLTYFTIPG